MHKLMRGALAGALATAPMTWVMVRLFYRLPKPQQYPLPPRLIMENITRRAAIRASVGEQAMKRATLVAHYGYGALTGALFPCFEREGSASLARGAAYGVAVWAASYLGWIPAARILTPAIRHPARRNALMLTAHLAWGTALAGSAALMKEPLPSKAGR